jgi:hypothetical protein
MQDLGEIPKQFAERYWKELQFNPWAFQKYFPLIFEYLDYSGPVPTIQEAEDVVIGTFEKSVRALSSSAWLPAEVTRDLAHQLRNHLSTQRTNAVRNGESQAQEKPSAPEETQADRAARRMRILEPILTKRGLSQNGWAVQAEVKWHTANDYLTGKTNPTKDTRKRLASVLGMEPTDLPD